MLEPWQCLVHHKESLGQILTFLTTSFDIDVPKLELHQLGVLVHGFPGSGKTTLLNFIRNLAHKKDLHCELFDCKKLFPSESSDGVESKVFQLIYSQYDVLLLDNIDDSSPDLSLPFFGGIASSFLNAFDMVKEHTNKIIVATYSSPKFITDSRFGFELTQSYRFGSPLMIGLPTFLSRKYILNSILQQNAVLKLDTFYNSSTNPLDFESKEVQFTAFISDLAERTNGLTTGEIINAIKTCVQNSVVRQMLTTDANESFTTSVSPVVISSEELCNYINNFCTNDRTNIDHNFSPMNAQLEFSDELKKPFQMEFLTPAVQERVTELLESLLTNETNFEDYCGGALFYGPSGSGKTALIHWILQNCKYRYKIFVLACADLVHKVVGQTEKVIAELFKAARSAAPSIVVFDNIDTIVFTNQTADWSNSSIHGKAKGLPISSRTTHKAIDRLLSTLLIEIDEIQMRDLSDKLIFEEVQDEGLDRKNGRVVVLATATNIAYLDRALLRPGRLEEHIPLDLPSSEVRKKIVRKYLHGLLPGNTFISSTSNDEQGTAMVALLEMSVEKMAERSKHWSFSDFESVFVEANMAFARNLTMEELIMMTSSSTEQKQQLNDLKDGNGNLFYNRRFQFVCQYLLNADKVI